MANPMDWLRKPRTDKTPNTRRATQERPRPQAKARAANEQEARSPWVRGDWPPGV